MVVKVLVPSSRENPPCLGRVHNVTHSRLMVMIMAMTMKMDMTMAMKTVVILTEWTTLLTLLPVQKLRFNFKRFKTIVRMHKQSSRL